jgi:EpsD family peptidyl-prolyl cis-trans isomerase
MLSLFRLRCSLVSGMIIVLAGCSSDDEIRNPGVAAKVNNAEISVHQVHRLLGPEGGPGRSGGQEEVLALERLIDQELIVQKARQRHLERDPEVARELEASRREILVRAYLDRVVGPASAPTEEEVRAFFEANPALFAERRVYELQEIAVQLGSEPFEALQEAVVDWLDDKGLAFRVAKVVRAAEQLPIDRLDDFARMHRGQVTLSPAPDGGQVIHLVGVRREPMDFDTARPVIEAYLRNDRMVEAARAELARLRGAARIRYGGDFIPGAEARGDQPASGEASASGGREPIKAAFERGVAGLK